MRRRSVKEQRKEDRTSKPTEGTRNKSSVFDRTQEGGEEKRKTTLAGNVKQGSRNESGYKCNHTALNGIHVPSSDKLRASHTRTPIHIHKHSNTDSAVENRAWKS